MGIKAKLCSSLVKIFTDAENTDNFSAMSLLSGEKGNFQLVILSDRHCTLKVSTDFSAASLYEVKSIYARTPVDKENCGDILLEKNGEPGLYPDLLDTFTGELRMIRDEAKSIWVNIDSSVLSPGEHKCTLCVEDETNITELTAVIKVCKTKLPEQELIHTNWFHSDCLATYYKVPVFSEEYWEITENFIKNAVSHGVNCILTPLFTPPLDTEIGGERPTVQLVRVKRCKNYSYEFDFTLLDRWVDMCLKNGVKYFEFSHLFTQWGAKHAPKIAAETSQGVKRIFGWETSAASKGYLGFLKQFGEALKEYTDNKAITDICFVHCSDEPSLDDIKHYQKASDAVREYFSAYEHIDALSDYDFYKEGLIGTPVPEEGSIEEFKGNVPKLWTYYCCGQYKNDLPNRFFSMPSIKNRILGVLLYKYDCTGFLHWGFNFYYTQYSKRALDPFIETDAGGSFPSGDSYIVYPGKDGKPLSSLRQKVFYDAIQDISALKAFEKKYSREYALSFIKDHLGDINFTSYPFEPEKLLKFRENLNLSLQ